MEKGCVVPRMLVAITNMEREKKLIDIYQHNGMPVCFHAYAQGTAPSALMDIFGLSGHSRVITAGVLAKGRVPMVFEQLNEKLSFSQKGKGVAFTFPVNGLQSQLLHVLNDDAKNAFQNMIEGDEKAMKEHAGYAAVMVSVSGGYSEDVIEAARSAGAKGGTIIKGMRANTEEFSACFGLPLKSEQDFVMIVVRKEQKKEIMTAIGNACGIKTEARGMVFSIPIDDVLGLE